MHIETERLILRQPLLSDAPKLFEFLGDADAMRYTHVDASLQECRRRIAVHERRRRRDGCAPWTILAKADNRIVGWGGLYDDPFDPGWGVEVGYYFHPQAWGRGYATELVRASVTFSDQNLPLSHINAFARRENAGSRRVLEKTGFEIVRYVREMDRLLYQRARRYQ